MSHSGVLCPLFASKCIHGEEDPFLTPGGEIILDYPLPMTGELEAELVVGVDIADVDPSSDGAGAVDGEKASTVLVKLTTKSLSKDTPAELLHEVA